MAWTKEQMCQIAAQLELKEGVYTLILVSVYTFTLVANYITQDMNIILQSENGMLGIGPFPFEGEEDSDLINAGKETITSIPESSYFDSATPFAMIREDHILI